VDWHTLPKIVLYSGGPDRETVKVTVEIGMPKGLLGPAEIARKVDSLIDDLQAAMSEHALCDLNVRVHRENNA
jgi:hypothetical protein